MTVNSAGLAELRTRGKGPELLAGRLSETNHQDRFLESAKYTNASQRAADVVVDASQLPRENGRSVGVQTNGGATLFLSPKRRYPTVSLP